MQIRYENMWFLVQNSQKILAKINKRVCTIIIQDHRVDVFIEIRAVLPEVAISSQLGYFCNPLGAKNRRGRLAIL